ncbi:Acyl-transf-3 domain-containing protein [Aphelenchoides bicaudatus]|nr:Acyl-transf-3 domain-containing protein [Aphelenchoides bicaudatus]
MIRSLNDIDFKQKADSLLLPEDQQKLLPIVKKPGKYSKIQKIQGLRGISIFVVLFYHIRNDWLPIGYLGVDVFFVISGFLMCHILNKEERLGRSQIIDFYFRRIKRIIPVYIFIILIFLLSAVFIWLHALMFNWVAQKAIKPLLYIANHITDMNYFALSNGNYKFFIHLWSLSVELQFYLIAPFLILFLSRVPPPAKIVVVSILAMSSFIYQKNATKENEHMALSSRIWQFMIGFLAYYLSKALTTNQHANEPGNSISSIRYKLVDFFFNYGVTFLFILCINVDLTGVKSYNRLILMFCTLICIAYPNSNMLLTNAPLVQLGDISYSVYLIHWFIFESHHYIHFEYYLYGQKAPCPIALFLITISVILGYIVEKSYNELSRYFNNWKSLLTYIFVAYLAIGVILLNLYLAGSKEQAIFRSENFMSLQNNSYYIDEVVMNIWKNKDTKTWKDADSIEFNDMLFLNRKRMFSCPESSRDSYVPTRYNLDPMKVTTTCYMKGNGTKNILVLGNSHTSSHFYGIERIFRDTYSNITAIADHQCVFFELDQQRSIMTEEKYQSCKVFNDDLFKMLEMWEHRIDIIILGHA